LLRRVAKTSNHLQAPAESFVKAQGAAIKAAEIDNNLPDAQLVLATVKFFYEWDFAGVEQAFRRAMRLNPNHEGLHRRYSSYLRAVKRFDESLTEIKQAHQRAPFQWALTVIEADILWYARRHDQALAKYREALELNPNNFQVHAQLADVYEQQGKYEEAMAEPEKAMAIKGHAPQISVALISASESGRSAEISHYSHETNAWSDNAGY
jgi:tetratricopeptide (TPR) repeat protein